LWWIPAGTAPLFALGLVPSERHVVFCSVGAAIFISIVLFKLSEWVSRGAKPSSIVLGCILLLAFSIPGCLFLKQRQAVWKHASEIATEIVEQTMNVYPIPERDTTFFFLNVPDSIDGAFVFRFENLGYALRLLYEDDSLEVVRIVTPDRVPGPITTNRQAARFRIGAMGGHIYLPENYARDSRLSEHWQTLQQLGILGRDFRFAGDWEKYAKSPFLIYTRDKLVPASPDELKKTLQELYLLF
jgi:hypothetical protein